MRFLSAIVWSHEETIFASVGMCVQLRCNGSEIATILKEFNQS